MGNTGEASDQNEMAQGDGYSFTNEALSNLQAACLQVLVEITVTILSVA